MSGDRGELYPGESRRERNHARLQRDHPAEAARNQKRAIQLARHEVKPERRNQRNNRREV